MPPSLRLRHSASAALVAAGLILMGIGAGCGGIGHHEISTAMSMSGRHRLPPPVGPKAAIIRRVHRSQSRHFALLRDRPEPLPRSITRILGKPDFGMNWALAHRLRLSMNGSFWLVPGNHALCLLHAQATHEVSAACAPTTVTLAHGIAIVSLREAGSRRPIERIVVGVAPDGAHRAAIHTGTAASTVSITRHVFVLKDSMSKPPDVVSVS